VTLGLGLLLVLAGCAREGLPYLEAKSLEAAKTMASEEGALIVVDFFTDNCGGCTSFVRAAKDSVQLLEALRGLVLHTAHVGTPAGRALADSHRVNAYPTFVVMNPAGELIAGWVGWRGVDAWAARMLSVRADPLTAAARRERLMQSPNARDAIILGDLAYGARAYREAREYYQQAMTLDRGAAREADVPLNLVSAVCTGVLTGDFTLADAGFEFEALLRAPDAAPDHVMRATEMLYRGVESVGVGPLRTYLDQAHRLVQGYNDPGLADRRQGLLVKHALIVEGDRGRALSLKREGLSAGWQSEPRELNSFAWWCFEQRINTEEAEALARRAIELSVPGPEQANYLDTLAELVHLRGETAEAVALIRRALALDPTREYLRKQLRRFEGVRDSVGSG
jgi:tetratricopeptide (TPR) repeat protein